jgi:hypothetical protein
MRFFFGVRKLVWVNGQEHERKSFKVWARSWHRTKITCRTAKIGCMPLYYTESDYGFRWQASGPKESFISYFVKYPTGSENPGTTNKKPAEDAKPKIPKEGKPVTEKTAVEK